MNRPILNNPDEYPDEKVLAKCLGRAKASWDALVKVVKRDESLQLVDWTYYRDGHNWLSRIMKKKKTICWISVWDHFFKVTFYFMDNDQQAKKLTSAIDSSIKKIWQQDNQGKKSRAITIEANKKTDVTIIKQLIEVKAALV